MQRVSSEKFAAKKYALHKGDERATQALKDELSKMREAGVNNMAKVNRCYESRGVQETFNIRRAEEEESVRREAK
jgi:hypothetical protein